MKKIVNTETFKDQFNYKSCHDCEGHGVVSDYGPFGIDFYGPKECNTCKGSGRLKIAHRSNRGTKQKDRSLH